MSGTTISTRELLDRDVTAVDVRSTRQQYSPPIARLSARDVATPEDIRRVSQAILDELAAIAGELSTIPFLGGVWIANQRLTSGVSNFIEHGIDGEVEVMISLPSASATIYASAQDADTRTVTIQTSATCDVSLLIFPKKRGQ
jgi:hypothetical protein